MFDFRATIKLAMTDSETPALVGAHSSWIYQACQGGPELIPVKARKVNRKCHRRIGNSYARIAD